MAKILKTSGKTSSGKSSTVSPTSKLDISLVNFPLTSSEIEWLKRQSKLVGEAYRRSHSTAAE